MLSIFQLYYYLSFNENVDVFLKIKPDITTN